jgi:transcriptional regulator with XRE-family HTH domain
MDFSPERLTKIRTKLGITKAEAAKRLNMSPMGYGRYELGQREPSYQTVSYIAQVFDTSVDYLYGKGSKSEPVSITITKDESPEIFDVLSKAKHDEELQKRLLAYCKKITKHESDK